MLRLLPFHKLLALLMPLRYPCSLLSSLLQLFLPMLLMMPLSVLALGNFLLCDFAVLVHNWY